MLKPKTSYNITLDNCSFHYEKMVIISDVSRVLQQGQKVLISGPSGSGKTTFLRLVGGIVSPTSGTLSVGEISGEYPQDKRFTLFGYHFVDGDFFEEMSTRDNILMLANIMDTPIDMSWYEELLEYFEMGGYESTRVNELSAGQRERVSIIRAFVHQPRILLLDEPGSHLDTALQSKLASFIAEYHEKNNATFIISSHGGFENSFFDTFIDFHADYHVSIR